jgi:solute carrier family 25 (mitochondrial phosphate transporter), member 3
MCTNIAVSKSTFSQLDVQLNSEIHQTRKQVDPELINTSFAKATARIVEQEGPSALLSGLGPTTMGYFFEGSLKFGIYEILKPAAQRALAFLANGTGWGILQSQFLSFVVCGAVSGIAASLILCPMEAIRIRRVAEPSSLESSWVEGGYQMVKTEGISALSKGLVPMLYKQVPYTISKNVAFDVLTRASYGLWRTGGWRVTNTCKIVIPLICAIFTSVLATLGSQPGDVLLSLVNAHEGNKRTNDFVRELWPQGGIRAFFVGTKSRLLHVGIIVTLQLILYDTIKRLAGIAATGSV